VGLFDKFAQPRRRKPAFYTYNDEACLCVTSLPGLAIDDSAVRLSWSNISCPDRTGLLECRVFAVPSAHSSMESMLPKIYSDGNLMMYIKSLFTQNFIHAIIVQ
jgi:hypothetical protein